MTRPPPARRRRSIELRTHEARSRLWQRWLGSLGDLSGPPPSQLLVLDRGMRAGWVVGCPAVSSLDELHRTIAVAAAITVAVDRVGAIAFATPLQIDDGPALVVVDVQPGVAPWRWVIPYTTDGAVSAPWVAAANSDPWASDVVAALRIACEQAGAAAELDGVLAWQRGHGFDPRQIST